MRQVRPVKLSVPAEDHTRIQKLYADSPRKNDGYYGLATRNSTAQNSSGLVSLSVSSFHVITAMPPVTVVAIISNFRLLESTGSRT